MNSYELSSKDLLTWRKKQLALGGKKEDLDWLLDLAGGLGWSELQSIYLDQNKNCILSQPLQELSLLWEQHIFQNIPLQYLIGKCPWRDFELEVNSSVMIPRQETELLIDLAINKIKNLQNGRWADLGTGSGALGIALARRLDSWEGHMVDISKSCLKLAQKNIQLLAKNRKYYFHLGFWWEPLKPWWGGLDLVVANPPYIPLSELQKLDPIVLKNEPHTALYGGDDGLKCFREIIPEAINALAPGGHLLMEHHYDQSDLILELMNQVGLVNLDFKKDLQGIKRFAIGSKLDIAD